MATRDPFSLWKPFSSKSQVPLTHDIVCVHTMVGTLAGSFAFANQAGNPYWHYGVHGSGETWQCQDLAFRSAANLDGNWHVISIETSDMKEGFFPDTWQNPPWTTHQVNALVQLIAWLCVRFNIPPVLVPDTCKGRRGLAYHRMGISPALVSGCERWSKANGKICPAGRAEQFVSIVIPRVQALVWHIPTPEDNDMDVNEFVNALNEGERAAERVQRQANQGSAQAISDAATTTGSALRTAMRNIAHEEAEAAAAPVLSALAELKALLTAPPAT